MWSLENVLYLIDLCGCNILPETTKYITLCSNGRFCGMKSCFDGTVFPSSGENCHSIRFTCNRDISKLGGTLNILTLNILKFTNDKKTTSE